MSFEYLKNIITLRDFDFNNHFGLGPTMGKSKHGANLYCPLPADAIDILQVGNIDFPELAKAVPVAGKQVTAISREFSPKMPLTIMMLRSSESERLPMPLSASIHLEGRLLPKCVLEYVFHNVHLSSWRNR